MVTSCKHTQKDKKSQNSLSGSISGLWGSLQYWLPSILCCLSLMCLQKDKVLTPTHTHTHSLFLTDALQTNSFQRTPPQKSDSIHLLQTLRNEGFTTTQGQVHVICPGEPQNLHQLKLSFSFTSMWGVLNQSWRLNMLCLGWMSGLNQATRAAQTHLILVSVVGAVLHGWISCCWWVFVWR